MTFDDFGAVVSTDYLYVFSHGTARKEPGSRGTAPQFRIDCELDRSTVTKNQDGTEVIVKGSHDPDGRCCVAGLRGLGTDVAPDTKPGKCRFCGNRYVHGDVWLHVPTGRYVCVGQNCADGYLKFSSYRRGDDWKQWKLNVLINRAKAAFLLDHPGLEEALRYDNVVVGNIASSFYNHGILNDYQVELVHRLGREGRLARETSAEKPRVPAPVGEARVKFRGTVVAEDTESNPYSHYGGSPSITKILVEVATSSGIWFAWGTAPAACVAGMVGGSLKGRVVDIVAKLIPSQGQDLHFVIMNRPHGVIVSTYDR